MISVVVGEFAWKIAIVLEPRLLGREGDRVSSASMKAKREVTVRMAARRPTSVDIEIGRLIRERRVELGLNQQQLADRIGIAVQQQHKYETGENRVAASRLVDISRELGVPVAWFFERAGAPAAPVENRRAPEAPARELLIIFKSLSLAAQLKLIEIAKLLRQ